MPGTATTNDEALAIQTIIDVVVAIVIEKPTTTSTTTT
mgnify:CR=1 FL=1